ncbi:phosphoribosylanthranilate isomerase [Candidatus Pelagibacter sp.]|uniref:phosphoribosylanthranilate isomerase n=1 Tax=Candidatus Pelagibacter sp. TaxID=2024849 RepID=UPI003F839953
MIQNCKICGVKDSQTLKYITNHKYPPKMIGFICNWPKSKRFVSDDQLKELLKIDKRGTSYVAVLVNPNDDTLEKVKDLPFDYYQLYDCEPQKIRAIKEKYNKKIISVVTVEEEKDVLKYKDFEDISDVILFDSKGYHNSVSFDHNYLDKVNTKLSLMIAGNIKIEDVPNLKDKNFCIDMSGGLETEGIKDTNKIDKFLNSVHNLNS